MTAVLPPEWLCIDRYRSDAIKIQRIMERAGVVHFDQNAMKGGGQHEPRHTVNWGDAEISGYVIEEAQTKSYSEIAAVLGTDANKVRAAYKGYQESGLCGSKPRISNGNGIRDFTGEER